MIPLSNWFASCCLTVVVFGLLCVDVGVVDFVFPKPKADQIGTVLGRIDVTGDNDRLKAKVFFGAVDARKLHLRNARRCWHAEQLRRVSVEGCRKTGRGRS